MLGRREVSIYGGRTLDDINRQVVAEADHLGVHVEFHQSNHEGELVTIIQEGWGKLDGIVLNAAAYTHTSVAIRDAIAAAQVPTVEVHISNVFKRESFRHTSYIAPVCIGRICGLGAFGYVLGLRALIGRENLREKAQIPVRTFLVLSGDDSKDEETEPSTSPGESTREGFLERLHHRAGDLGVRVEYYPVDSEKATVDLLRSAAARCSGILIHAGGEEYHGATLRHAIEATGLPAIVVHETPAVPAIAPVCVGVVGGFGAMSPLIALDALAHSTGKASPADEARR